MATIQDQDQWALNGHISLLAMTSTFEVGKVNGTVVACDGVMATNPAINFCLFFSIFQDGRTSMPMI